MLTLIKEEAVEVSCSFKNLGFMVIKSSASVVGWTKKARRNFQSPKLQQPSEICVYFGSVNHELIPVEVLAHVNKVKLGPIWVSQSHG